MVSDQGMEGKLDQAPVSSPNGHTMYVDVTGQIKNRSYDIDYLLLRLHQNCKLFRC